MRWYDLSRENKEFLEIVLIGNVQLFLDLPLEIFRLEKDLRGISHFLGQPQKSQLLSGTQKVVKTCVH